MTARNRIRVMRRTTNLSPHLWNDPHIRQLPATAQWLYLMLHTHQDLNQAGIIDWHPARLAAMSNDLIAEDVEIAGQQLEDAGYLTIDHDTQEAYIDGYNATNRYFRSPNMGIAVGTAAQATYSRTIRAALKDELRNLAQQNPNNSALHVPQIQDLITE